jgi:carboxyl-terminal processing protease
MQEKTFLRSFIIISFLILSFPLYSKDKTDSRYEKIELFNKVLYLIENQYYRTVDTEKLIQGAIRGMMNTLDPHSAFLDPEVFKKMQEDTSGEFGGLGIEVTMKKGIITIITPIDGGPAQRAGIRPGDRIIEINHGSTLGLTLEEAVGRLRSENKKKVILGISRKGLEGIKDYVIKRETIKINPIKSEIVHKNYAYVRLVQFQKRSALTMAKALKGMRKKLRNKGGIKGIILDLRSNPGGLLDEAVNVSSLFLKEGVVVSTEGREKKSKEFRYVKKTGPKYTDEMMVVLIDGASASASEIVAGCLQDYKRAIIMGTPSFGKGSVQTVAQIDSEQGIKLTVAQYMTPSGKKIQAIGINPDVYVDSIDYKVFETSKSNEAFVRERDLRNHLTATIESAEEKKMRLQDEEKRRKMRVKKIKELQAKEKGKKKPEAENFSFRKDPSKDYQVLQAVNLINSLSVLGQVSPNTTKIK